MKKWFCDYCKKEIKEGNIYHVNAYTEVEGRESGYSESDYFIKKECHEDCAEKIKAALRDAIKR